MESRVLGPEGLTVSALGLGCMGMSQAYGSADDTESVATVRRAIDLGITFIDTAMSYGAGHNERLVGRALVDRRDQVTLATKFGIVRDATGPVRVDAHPARIRRYCEASLARLGVDHIDLYYLHRVDPEVPIEHSVEAMAKLVVQGKVRHLGVSECTGEQLHRAARVHPISAVQVEWSLWWREAEDDLLPAARALGVGVVPHTPLGRGFLTATVDPDTFGTDDFRRHDQRFQGEHLQRNRALLSALEEISADRGLTPGQLALAWLLARGRDVVPIPGTKRRTRLEENATAASVALSPAELALIDAVAPRRAWSGDRQAFAAPRTTRTPA